MQRTFENVDLGVGDIFFSERNTEGFYALLLGLLNLAYLVLRNWRFESQIKLRIVCQAVLLITTVYVFRKEEFYMNMIPNFISSCISLFIQVIAFIAKLSKSSGNDKPWQLAETI